MTARTLAEFFARVSPLLEGTQAAAEVEASLGPSPSGTAAFDFYGTLAERNRFKILRDLYEPLRLLVRHRDHDTWTRLVRAYAQAHPASHWDPNRFGEAFSDFLATERAQHGTLPALWEEIADFCWIRHRAHVAPDDVGDGFDQRLFVRHYTHDIPEVVRRLAEDPAAELPGAAPKILFVYRHARTLQVRLYFPSATGLAAIAARQGETLPAPFDALPAEQVAAADLALVEHGILTPKGPIP